VCAAASDTSTASPIGETPDWEKLEDLLPKPGFKVLPRRWVVERTFPWIDQNRRMSKDYERLLESGEAFIYTESG
jgi:transposase